MNSIVELIVGDAGNTLTIGTICAYMVFVMILETISSIAANVLKVGR